MKRLLLSLVVVCQPVLAQEIRDDDAPCDGYGYEEPSDGAYDGQGEHYHYHPMEDEPQVVRNVDSLSLNVPRHGRRGLTTTISVRYRKIEGNAIVRLRLSPALELTQTTPPAVRGPDGELLWFGLAGPMGSLKIKARIDERVAPGTALLIHADLFDSGRAEHETDTIVAR